jgi:hypothetical protein
LWHGVCGGSGGAIPWNGLRLLISCSERRLIILESIASWLLCLGLKERNSSGRAKTLCRALTLCYSLVLCVLLLLSVTVLKCWKELDGGVFGGIKLLALLPGSGWSKVMLLRTEAQLIGVTQEGHLFKASQAPRKEWAVVE